MRVRAMAVTVLVLAATACGAKPAAAPKASPTLPPSPPSTPSPSPSSSGSPSPTSSHGPFIPDSVTFVSAKTGWVLGGLCSTCPSSLLQTRDGGATWASVPAPPTSLGTDSGTGVREVRFANLNDGWVFGAEIWATHDGGAHWTQPTLPGWTPGRVDGLEAAAGVVHAVALGGPNGFLIASSPVGRDAWTASTTTLPYGAGPVPGAQMVLRGTSGWVIENDRTVVSGARLENGAWVPWEPPCRTVGGPATLAAGPGVLAAVCEEGIWTGPSVSVHAYLSSDGTAFHRLAAALPTQDLRAAAAPGPGVIVVGADASSTPALLATFDGGSSWTPVFKGGTYEGWNDLGFTSPVQGVVVDTVAGTLLMTHDGGHTWHPVPLPPR